MFSQDTLIKIFEDKEVQRVPIVYQSIMIRAIDRILDELNLQENIKQADK